MVSLARELFGLAIIGYVLSGPYIAAITCIWASLADDWFSGVSAAAAGVLPLTIVVTGWRLARRGRRRSILWSVLGVLLLLTVTALGVGYLR